MRYNGIKCEKCGIEFNENDDVVVCPVCGAPHHRSCWLEENTCVHTSRHIEGYQWQMPENAVEKAEPEQKKPLPDEFMLKNGESVVICPRCGAMNCENDVYCMRCGAPLKNERSGGGEYGGAGFGNGGSDDADGQRGRMYADFNRFGGLDPNSELDGIPVVEYSDYVGGKAPGKILRKIAVMDRFGKPVSWCWPAVFIGPVWFFWRKMKKEGLILSVLLLIFCIGAGLLQINAPLERFYKDTYGAFAEVLEGKISREELQQRMDDYANIYSYADLTHEEEVKYKISVVLNYLAEPGIPIACTMLSMYFYKKKVRKSVLEIRNRCTNMDEYRNALIADGGTSIGWAAVGAVLYIGAFFCANYLPMLIIMFK